MSRARSHPHAAAERAFTLVELLLALLLGGVVLLGVLGLLGLSRQADQVLAQQHRTTLEHFNVQTVVRRAWANLVLSSEANDQPPPEPVANPNQQNGGQGGGQTGGQSGNGQSGNGQSGNGQSGGSRSGGNRRAGLDASGPGSRLPDDPTAGRIVLTQAGPNNTQGQGQSGAADDDNTTDDDDAQPLRGRIVLETDTYLLAEEIELRVDDLGDNAPQVLELVTRTTPIPESLIGFRSAELPTAEQLGEVFTEASGGVRGVFELRPDGAREAFMARYGWEPVVPFAGVYRGRANDPETAQRQNQLTWSLWYRPLTSAEIEDRRLGNLPDPRDHAARLAASYRLATGLIYCKWTIATLLKNEQGKTVGSSLALLSRTDPNKPLRSALNVPAFCRLEMLTITGGFASYLFEPGWFVLDDPELENGPEDGADGSTTGGDGSDNAGNPPSQGGNTPGGDVVRPNPNAPATPSPGEGPRRDPLPSDPPSRRNDPPADEPRRPTRPSQSPNAPSGPRGGPAFPDERQGGGGGGGGGGLGNTPRGGAA